MPEQRCDNCRFWEAVDDEEGTGFCRRYAPRPVLVQEGDPDNKVPRWPLTLATDWCGEHQPQRSER